MLGTTIFQNPYSNDNLQKNMEIQMLRAQQVIPQQQQNTVLDDIAKNVSSLSTDEQVALGSNQAFIEARSLYERTFIDFLGGKFKQEFLNTQTGSQVAQNLSDVTNSAISSIRERSRSEREKLSRLSQLLEENPNLLTELEAKKNGKETK